MNSRWLVQASAIAVLAGSPAFAQQAFVYPARGQSPAQQQKDEYECHAWAVQQTGYDPTRPQAAAPAAPAPGSGVGGAARGALVGGAINGSDGAAAGAVIGGIAGRQRSRQQQQAASNAAGPNAYNRARAGCLSGRGYTVS